MSKTFKDLNKNRDKKIRKIKQKRVRRDGYLFPDSDMALIDQRDEREFDYEFSAPRFSF